MATRDFGIESGLDQIATDVHIASAGSMVQGIVIVRIHRQEIDLSGLQVAEHGNVWHFMNGPQAVVMRDIQIGTVLYNRGAGDWLSADEVRADYVYGTFQGPSITMLGSLAVGQTDRGDDMFMAMAERCCAQIRDLDAFSVLA